MLSKIDCVDADAVRKLRDSLPAGTIPLTVLDDARVKDFRDMLVKECRSAETGGGSEPPHPADSGSSRSADSEPDNPADTPDSETPHTDNPAAAEI